MGYSDSKLLEFRRALDKLYGERLERAVLFGSRARGDATTESDYDVAVFLKAMPDRWAEFDRLIPLRLDFLAKYDTDFSVLPFQSSDLEKRTGLMHAIRTEGQPF
jgi:predicted nucleotidyltransferase